MELKDKIIAFSADHPKWITWTMVLFTLACAVMIPMIRVDTDPENMLSSDEPVRVFHNQTKQRFDLSDIVVLGVINETHPAGVFNAATLNRVYELTEFARTLRWEDPKNPGKQVGVVEVDIIAPSLIDHIEGGGGMVRFEWLMPQPPKTDQEALEIREKVMSNQLLRGTMVSEDGKALMLLLPLTDKHLSYRVYSALNKKIAQLRGTESYHITGLPVAEDTFGVEMFIQMAVSAPLAMVTIFLLMLLFFRKLVLILSPMIIAMVSVITTMGLLIGFGYPVHIMSSMIPIFLMPIAVVDSVHILSEFFDRYTQEKGRRQTILEVMHVLFVPMLYTSLTSAAGFLSLALTPIPPVQVFGVFVSVGIMIAWVFTVTFVPAYVMLLPERTLANFGLAVHQEEAQTWLTRLLARTGRMTVRQAKPILAVLVLLSAGAVYGITQIVINDNPVKWFSKRHPIRQADIALNEHFGGTYMAYLVLRSPDEHPAQADFVQEVQERLRQLAEHRKDEEPSIEKAAVSAGNKLQELAANGSTATALMEEMIRFAQTRMEQASDQDFYGWQELEAFFGVERERLRPFKRPEVLVWMKGLQTHLEKAGLVGKSNSIADIVMKVNQELVDGRPESFRVPEKVEQVAECLIQYQNSHRPQDLWHMVTQEMTEAVIWMQLTSGDNRDMERVVRAVEEYWKNSPPPIALEHQWAGLTYINIIWQNKMVWGMLQSFLGSFLVVFIMMAILFRSVLWGLICMIPLTITIVMIYGLIGWLGKDYDMPVAVLSALTLGMAVDFAIHFLERAREHYRKVGSWEKVSEEMFGEPARAITRNVLVIAIGFLPLLAAPLVPYKTVGIFLCAIMALSGVVTLLVLPALLKIGEKVLFRPVAQPVGPACNCGFCLILSISTVVLIALNVHQYWQVGVGKLTWISLGLIPLLALTCGLLSRRQACRMSEPKNAVSSEEGR
ncbi:MAG: MMPL family transporter [Anaerohalosphaeraceae bacterium]